MPAEVDRILRERARTKHMSINQITIDELVRATTVVRRLADFSDVVGKWEPDAALDEFLQSQRTIDESDWA